MLSFRIFRDFLPRVFAACISLELSAFSHQTSAELRGFLVQSHP